MVKNPPANAEDVSDVGSIPGSGRSAGGGPGNPLQYSCLENYHIQRRKRSRGAWQASLWVRKEWDMTEVTLAHTQFAQ